MRDLIVANIKQLIVLLRERGTVIEIKDILTKKKKSLVERTMVDIKEEVDNTNSLSIEGLDLETKHCETIFNQQEFVQEIDYIFTVTEVSISVVSSLIHVSMKILHNIVSGFFCKKIKSNWLFFRVR